MLFIASMFYLISHKICTFYVRTCRCRNLHLQGWSSGPTSNTHSPPNSKSKNTLLQTSKSNMNIQHVVSPELKWKALPLDEEDEEDPVEVAAPHEDRGGLPRFFRWKEWMFYRCQVTSCALQAQFDVTTWCVLLSVFRPAATLDLSWAACDIDRDLQRRALEQWNLMQRAPLRWSPSFSETRAACSAEYPKRARVLERACKSFQ